MAWQRLRIRVRAEIADAIGDALLEAGALSVDASDAAFGTPDEHPIFGEPGAEPGTAWPDTEIAALLPENADGKALLIAAAGSLGMAVPPAVFEDVPEQDWVRLTQSQFAPIAISPRLWIVPTWHEPPAGDRSIVIRLDPGLAFGTGSHPTTRLCLRWLDEHLSPGESVLDYGCGSGILAIAARKLGAGAVRGIDVDPNAVAASRDNAALNEVDIEFAGADEPRRGGHDIVVANILTNPLRVLAPLLSGAVRRGGRLVLSGILETQRDSVIDAYRAWIDFGAPVTEEGWVCLWGTKR